MTTTTREERFEKRFGPGVVNLNTSSESRRRHFGGEDLLDFINQECRLVEEGALKNLEKAMDDYKFHAGVWHNFSCDFPEVDHAVCNCSHSLIRKEILALLSNPI